MWERNTGEARPRAEAPWMQRRAHPWLGGERESGEVGQAGMMDVQGPLLSQLEPCVHSSVEMCTKQGKRRLAAGPPLCTPSPGPSCP